MRVRAACVSGPPRVYQVKKKFWAPGRGELKRRWSWLTITSTFARARTKQDSDPTRHSVNLPKACNLHRHRCTVAVRLGALDTDRLRAADEVSQGRAVDPACAVTPSASARWLPGTVRIKPARGDCDGLTAIGRQRRERAA